jgi:hypothetical protein
MVDPDLVAAGDMDGFEYAKRRMVGDEKRGPRFGQCSTASTTHWPASPMTLNGAPGAPR